MNKPENPRSKELITFAVVIGIGLLGGAYHLWLDSLPQRFTVGEIRGLEKIGKGDLNAKFIYSIDSIEYTKYADLQGRDRRGLIGARYLVRIPVGHEGLGKLMWDRPVPKGINPPPEGWKELPKFKLNHTAQFRTSAPWYRLGTELQRGLLAAHRIVCTLIFN